MIIILIAITIIACVTIICFTHYKLAELEQTKQCNCDNKPSTEKIKPAKPEKISKEDRIRYEKELKKLQQVWDNVGSYDGSEKNQKKVG